MDKYNDYIARETEGGARVDIYLLKHNAVLVRFFAIMDNPWEYDANDSSMTDSIIELSYPSHLNLKMVIDNVFNKVPEMIIEKFNDRGVYIVKNLEQKYDMYNSLPYSEENIHSLLRYDKEEIFDMEHMLEYDLLTFGEVKESGEVILPEPKYSYDKRHLEPQISFSDIIADRQRYKKNK